MTDDHLLSEDNDDIKIVPAAARDVWTRHPRVEYTNDQIRQDREARAAARRPVRRSSPSRASALLHLAQREEWITGFDRIDGKPVRWAIQVPSTHHDNYFGRAVATIVLTTREVFAFIEGCYAATGHHPVCRAGSYHGDDR